MTTEISHPLSMFRHTDPVLQAGSAGPIEY